MIKRLLKNLKINSILSAKILNNAKNIMFLVTGKEKKDLVSKIINNNKGYAAGKVDNKEKIYFLLDKSASPKL